MMNTQHQFQNGHRVKCLDEIPNVPSAAGQQRMVDDWNSIHCVGTKVRVALDDGSWKDSFTKSPAWLLGGHTAVIMVDGISGGYSLARVTTRI